jgi:non-heme chloroperoxidase
VITYDRRGFGTSSTPALGYDYDTLASDLKVLIEELDLPDTALVGFSMGTGEVARYLGNYGSERVSKAVLAGPIPPSLFKTPTNPLGVDQSVFTKMQQAILADRPAFLTEFFADFFNFDVLGGTLVSDEAMQMCWTAALNTSPIATYESVASWFEDFREDLPEFDEPTLIMQGVEGRVLPIDATGAG